MRTCAAHRSMLDKMKTRQGILFSGKTGKISQQGRSSNEKYKKLIAC